MTVDNNKPPKHEIKLLIFIMKIYDNDKFEKYVGHPVRIKQMFPSVVAIAEGALLASFNTLNELRQYFPYGNYVKIE